MRRREFPDQPVPALDTYNGHFYRAPGLRETRSRKAREMMCFHQRTEPITIVNYKGDEIWLDRCKDCGVLLG